MKHIYLLSGLRFVIAIVYITSGAEKLLQPYQNFVYVIQGYDLLRNPALEQAIARVFPWLEYYLGGLLLAGLWMRFALAGIAVFSGIFVFAVGQAIVRHLPLDECGCFGDLVGMPLQVTLLIDVGIFVSALVLIRSDVFRCRFALDQLWRKKAHEGS